MANPEHLKILKEGVAAWNAWRKENREVRADLRKAELVGADLGGAVLGGANLRRAKLRRAKLIEADLIEADFFGANFTGANLSRVNLGRADLSKANLSKVDFSEANLGGANLSGANLAEATFARVRLYETILADVDLSNVQGLESCTHFGPSTIDHRTLQRSGRLPRVFLRGCGLPDRLIEYADSLLKNPIEFHSCFISHSAKDETFAKRLHADLQQAGVRCWFAPEDLKIGDETWDAIDRAIQVHSRLLLILSKRSIASDWVEDEVTKAYAEERRRRETVLFPIRIDNAVKQTDEPWAAKVWDGRHIGDFTRWKDPDAYNAGLKRLLRDLKAGPEMAREA